MDAWYKVVDNKTTRSGVGMNTPDGLQDGEGLAGERVRSKRDLAWLWRGRRKETLQHFLGA